ncbi:MAG: pimeloyl-ACP methyl ester carboxylesterase [Candidatus Poriferisodalaceae bacterium]|jgi:pimeloyl-ACP methyl ester carboxylesterase
MTQQQSGFLRRRLVVAVLSAVVVLAASCGDSDPATSATPTSAGSESAPTTAAAPLRPDLRLDATGGVGSIPTWVDDWNSVVESLQTQNADFPDLALDVDQFRIGTSAEGITVFGGFIDTQVALGGAVQADDGGISSLMVFGSAEDPLFFAAYAVWLGTLNPTLSLEAVLPPEVAFGDSPLNAVVLGGRSYEAVRTISSEGDALATVTMVPGLSDDTAILAGSHQLLRASVIAHLASLEEDEIS